jgi:hypothetical protein
MNGLNPQFMENAKACLTILYETYLNGGGHPNRDRYTAYAMRAIVEDVSKDFRQPKMVIDDFCEKWDICQCEHGPHWIDHCDGKCFECDEPDCQRHYSSHVTEDV